MAKEVTRNLDMREAIAGVVAGNTLSETQAYAVAATIMDGGASPAQIAALLVALAVKGETVEEITGFVQAMRDKVDRVPVEGSSLVDTCGTGGDSKGTFNVSTLSAIVAAGAGCRVAKHGNRSVSSRCGSSDLLETLGVSTDLGPADAGACLERTGACFLFAPLYHRATKHAAEPRKEIGIRSIFNIVGPLTNPAGAGRQLMGVFKPELTETAARVLQRLGSVHCMVVHGEDGLDEITLDGCTRVSELKDGEVRTYRLDPGELGFKRRSAAELQGGSPGDNAAIALDVLSGIEGPAREIVVLNAAAVIHVGGRASSLADGVGLATESIDSGRALGVLGALRSEAKNHHE